MIQQHQRTLTGVWLGRRDYLPVYDLMLALLERRKNNTIGDVILLVEHNPVITLGRGAQWNHLLASREALANRGVQLVKTDRGGDITLHAPGQLVGYPIVSLKPDRCDVRRYVHDLAHTMNEVVRPYGIEGGRIDKMVGLWVDAQSRDRFPGQEHATQLMKLGAIGVRVSKWVTMHGFALNLSTDLDLFRLIVPCGISEHPVTTLEQLTGERLEVAVAAERAAWHFARVFNAKLGDFRDHSRGGLEGLATAQSAVASSASLDNQFNR